MLKSPLASLSKRNLLIAAAVLVVMGVLFSLLAIHKTVTLVMNGNQQKISTWALTVGGFLQSQDVDLAEQDQLSHRKGKLIWGGETIHLRRASQITLFSGEEIFSLVTAEKLPGNIILEAEIPLYPGDQVFLNGRPTEPDQALAAGPSHTLQVQPATLIELDTGTRVMEFYTGAATIAGALHEQNIPLYEGDQISPSPATPLAGKPIEVSMRVSRPIQIALPDKTLTIRSASKTVGAALADAALPLQGLDYSIPAEESPLPEDEPVRIIRVAENFILNQEPIEFTTEYQATDELGLDQEQILKGGEYGLKAQRVRVISENGSEINREVEKEWVVKAPQPRVIGYGTQINIRTANTPDGQIKYWRKITAYATSYNKNCPGCDNWTASGTRLKKGTVAVTLEWYRYMKGAKIYIPGYGFGTIEDVGGGIPGKNWVDLGYEVENYVPWSQNVEVYFLAPAPPPENIMFILY